MELPVLADLLGKYGKDGLEVIAVNEKDNASKIKSFLNEKGYPFTVFRAVGGERDPVALYGVIGSPTTYVIGPDGKIRSSLLGGSIPTLRRMIDETLKTKATQ